MAGSGTVTGVAEAVTSLVEPMVTVTLPRRVLPILIVAAIFKVVIMCPSGVTGALVTEP